MNLWLSRSRKVQLNFYQEGRETKQHNYNNFTTTIATTNTNNTTTQTQIDTNFDHITEENKSIHGN
jgi:hypothetical protein